MRIEVLVVPDCPHEKAAVELLRHALDDAGLTDVTWDRRVVADQDAAERIGFAGSPTFLIDGRDPFAEPGRAPGLTCRMYPTPQGPAGLPTRDRLRQALTSACPAGGAPAGAGGEAQQAREQRRHWQDTYAAHPGMYGAEPSAPAVHAAGVFRAAGAERVLELGAGHGRDALYFAREGFAVHATDFSSTGLDQLREASRAQGLADRIATTVHDVRSPLPFPDDSVDAVFAHMLLCMALTTREIHALVAEVRRVLRPGGVFVYTVRHTGDAHYAAGTSRGDDIYEHGGFAVHFFPRRLVDGLAGGWRLDEVHGFEEGELPRRLWRITQTLA
ncbi:class I SAM-dependent methyltransferase [Streptomyces sp. GS7]|uniref:class I SAM-dependent methyltransferase n=1 Tax=Streptomyces sp. GS7 TaxID=2692234 RepID=UPI001F348CEE|nr:class I SAM-dependent methyltransferase [Streptomyces sp. GS7]